jgi:Tol biopolymer transport system component
MLAGLVVALLAGCRPAFGGRTTRITTGPATSWEPDVSHDGGYVVYTAQLPTADSWLAYNVYLWERSSGRTVRITASDTASRYPSVSSHGRFVAFHSAAPDLVPGDTNNAEDVFLWERATGQLTQLTEGNAGSMHATISDDGRYVTFWSHASDLVPGDTNASGADRFRLDRSTGDVALLARDSCSDAGDDGTVSDDGRFVTYTTSSGPFPGDVGDPGEVFLCDRERGTTLQITDSEGASFAPVVSGDGRYVAFTSRASDLVAGDTNDVADVFVWSRRTGTFRRISDLRPFEAEIVYPPEPVISDDGRVVAYRAFADQEAWLAGRADVFVGDRPTGTTLTLPEALTLEKPTMSGNGHVIAYVADAGSVGTIDVWRRSRPHRR